MQRHARLALTALIIPLTLAACGGAEGEGEQTASEEDTSIEETTEENPAAVYDFTVERFPVASGPVQVVFPEQLRSDVDVPIASLTLSPHELDSNEYCAVNVDLEFTEGGREALAAPSFEGPQREGGNRDEQSVIEGNDAILHAMNLSKNSAPFPEQETNYETSVEDISELESGELHGGTYASDDLDQIVVVQECAQENAGEYETGDAIVLPQIMGDDTPNNAEDAAEFEFTIMKSGSIGIVNGEVDGYVPDGNGDWIAD